MSRYERNLRFAHIVRTVRTRQRLMFLITGVVAFIAGIALRNLVVCMCGMLIAGSFAWDALPGSPTSSHVHMWQWLNKSTGKRR
jgi:hypothetical protein